MHPASPTHATHEAIAIQRSDHAVYLSAMRQRDFRS
jgi:hypothetical protein